MYVRKRAGRGFTGSYATPFGGKRRMARGIPQAKEVLSAGHKTKYFKGKGIAFTEKAANSGTYVV
jgi:hypothetical protein